MNMDALELYKKLSHKPFGKRIFSKIFCMKAPYFKSIHPFFENLEAGNCVITMKKRRSVQNHIGSIHAIAMCNMAEAAAGLCLEATIPKHLRWIPKSMSVEYLKKANTDLRGTCTVDPQKLMPGENSVDVDVVDAQNERVFKARITMYVSERK
jgi:acyl-coenzyme A thioesterase PaaI-like protein